MRLSKYFVKTMRQTPSEEVSLNAQLLMRAWFVWKEMAWVYSYLPLGLRVLRKIENLIRSEMESLWGQEILMPSLQPKTSWLKTGRWDAYDALFKFLSYYSKIDYVLWPTHEEVIVPLMKKFVFSYKDLPAYVFQIQNKFRDEKRAKSWILRGREFLMKDLYSFHTSESDLDSYYETVKKSYATIFDKVGIGKQTYLTFASWWTFAKYSHEYQTITDAWEDLIYLCKKCNIAINKEIIDSQKECPECWNHDLQEIKAVEVWNIFKLKNKFSNPFGLKYKNQKWEENDVMMWCYGIWIGRLMWTIVEVLHDKDGIKWPLSIAPYKYIIIPIWETGKQKWEEIYKYLQDKWQEVIIDDREESPWFKFKDADLIGIPYQIVVSDKTLANWDNMVELKDRNNGEKKIVNYKESVETCRGTSL